MGIVAASSAYSDVGRPGRMVPPEPPPSPQLVAAWNFDETSGNTVASSPSGFDGAGTSLERNLSPLLADGGKSGGFDGASAKVQVGHQSAFLLHSYSVVVYFQLDTLPAANTNVMLVDKDDGLPPGGFSIEVQHNGTTVNFRAFIRNATGGGGTATEVRSTTPIVANTAYRGVLTVDSSAGAKIWVNNGGAEDTDATRTHGLQTNVKNLHFGMYRGALAPMDGVLDRIELWNGALDQTAIDALPAAVTITHGGGGGGGSFACANRPSPAITNTHKNLGTVTSVRQLSVGGNARYDFTGTTLSNIYNATNNTYSPSFNVRFTADHDGGCAFGGTIINGYSRQRTQSRRYPTNDAGQFFIRDRSAHNFLIDSWRFNQNWDPIRLGGGVSGVTISNITIRKCWFSNTYDDTIENDSFRDGLVVEDCLSDNTYVFISARTNGTTNFNHRIATVRDCLIAANSMYTGNPPDGAPLWGLFFKLNRFSLSFDLFNNIFLVPQVTDRSNGDLFKDLLTQDGANGANGGRIRNSSGNIIVWQGGGSYPFTVPTGFSVVTTLSTWTNARNAWLSTNSHVPRIPGVDT